MDILLASIFFFGTIIAIAVLIIGVVLAIFKKPAKRTLKSSGIIFSVSILSLILFMVMHISSEPAQTATNQTQESTQEFEPATNEEETSNDETSTVNQESEENDEDDRGMRTNPIPFGESTMRLVDIDDPNQDTGFLRLTLSNLISGEEAYNFLLNENQFNEPAPEGYKWIVFDVEAELVTGSENVPYVSMPNVSTVSENGSESPNGHFAVVNDEYGHTDLYNGGTATGKIATIAPEDEDYLIKWVEDYKEPVFFDNK